ncbi:MAG: glycosyltransferase, partial [Bacteroidota bacterium]
MKILQVNSARSWRGGEQQLAYLLEGLSAQKVELHVVCRESSDLAKYCKNQQVAYTTLPFQGSWDRSTFRGLTRLLRQGNFDLVHLHTAAAHSQTVLAHARLRASVPLVLSRRILTPLRHRWFSRWKYNYLGIARYLAVSDAIRRGMEAYLKRPERVLTVHSGADPARFAVAPPYTWLHERFGIPPRTPLIGNASALEPSKDYLTFLATAKELTRQGLDAHYLLIGEG